MSDVWTATATRDGLTVKAYGGDRCVLLAFDMEEHLRARLAGFAVRRRLGRGKWFQLLNRLSFSTGFTRATTAEERKWFPTSEAPLQKFWWVDFPPEEAAGTYEYEVTAMRFKAAHAAELAADQSARLKVVCKPFRQGDFELAFTRGYLSSQAYADRFDNAPIRPVPKTIDYDSGPFQLRYQWLGAHGRAALFAFLERCRKTAGATVDALVYDLDEPDVIRALAALGPRLRIVMDSAALHTGAKAMEPLALEVLKASATEANVKVGKFDRYQHNKVFVMRVGGVAQRVLTGSTNFSVTGLYVNANHVAIFDGPDVAGLYARAFDAAFAGKAKAATFRADAVSQQRFEIARPGLPQTFFSFAPHADPSVSLAPLQQGIEQAASSVLFAVMALQGTGGVLDALRSLHATGKVFSYGITDNPGAKAGGEAAEDGDGGKAAAGVTVFGAGKAGVLVTSAALTKLVPPPFRQEREEGLAHKIHHKFVVVDFNDAAPKVFFGSSNLAQAGEHDNGDNLIEIHDRQVAAVFAIEAVRLVDHYAFRAALGKATSAAPLRLRFDDEDWAKNSYLPGHMKCRERLLFSR